METKQAGPQPRRRPVSGGHNTVDTRTQTQAEEAGMEIQNAAWNAPMLRKMARQFRLIGSVADRMAREIDLAGVMAHDWTRGLSTGGPTAPAA